MECQRCLLVVHKTVYQFRKFLWDQICERCRDRMKLEDWNRAIQSDGISSKRPR